MKKWLVACAVFISGCAGVQSITVIPAVDRESRQYPFGAGEQMTYAVKCRGMTVAIARFRVEKMSDFNGRPAFRSVCEVNSLPSFLYRSFSHRLESVIDAEKLVALKLESSLSEGKNQRNSRMVFNQEKQRVDDNGSTVKTMPDVQDVLSVLYYLRARELNAGSVISAGIYADARIWKMQARVSGPEKIKVKAGKFSCFQVGPVSDFGGIFEKTEPLVVWFSDDLWHMPVKMAGRTDAGMVSVELTEARVVNRN